MTLSPIATDLLTQVVAPILPSFQLVAVRRWRLQRQIRTLIKGTVSIQWLWHSIKICLGYGISGYEW